MQPEGDGTSPFEQLKTQQADACPFQNQPHRIPLETKQDIWVRTKEDGVWRSVIYHANW